MQDSWKQLKRDDKSTDPKGWIQGTPKLDPYWTSQPATCKANMEWKSEGSGRLWRHSNFDQSVFGQSVFDLCVVCCVVCCCVVVVLCCCVVVVLCCCVVVVLCCCVVVVLCCCVVVVLLLLCCCCVVVVLSVCCQCVVSVLSVCCCQCVGCWVLVLVWSFGPSRSPPPDHPGGPPKISLFLFPLPPPFRSCSLCLRVEFWWFLWSVGACVHVWALGLSCETTAASGPPELHTTPRELQTRTFDGPDASKHHQKTTRRHPERHKKEQKWERRGKNSAKFGAPTLRGPTLQEPDFFWVWAPPFGPHHDTHTPGSKWIGPNWIGQNWFWPKLVLAKIGLAKTGLAKTGLAKTGLAKTGLAKSGLANKSGLAKSGLAKNWIGQKLDWPKLDWLKIGQAKVGPFQSELNLLTKAILTRWSELLMAWTIWSKTWSTRSTTTSRRPPQWERKNLRFQADPSLKQNLEHLPQLAQGLYRFVKEYGLILNQELNQIERTQWQKG